MGSRKLKRQRFFETHATCCFCGGGVAATSIDHTPSRACFLGKAFPEGFEFPACEACQTASRLDEIVFSFVVRVSDFNEANVDRTESMRAIQGLINNHPALLPRIDLKASEKRAALRRMGLVRPRGLFLDDIPLVSLQPEMHEPIIRYARKISIALFYREIGKIAPADYLVWAMWGQTVNIEMRNLIKGLLGVTSKMTVGARKNVNIGDRFYYAFEPLKEPEALIIVGQFGKGLAFVSCVASPEARSAMTVPGWSTVAEALRGPVIIDPDPRADW